jgi:hypothetical protein
MRRRNQTITKHCDEAVYHITQVWNALQEKGRILLMAGEREVCEKNTHDSMAKMIEVLRTLTGDARREKDMAAKTDPGP